MVEFKTLKELDCSTDACTVKVRVIHFWKETRDSIYQTKGFNLLLMDDKGDRIQAVVPETISAKVQQIFSLGKVHLLHNFAVEYYRSDETYKCINYDKYIFLTEDSVIQEKPELELSIQQNAFDFYTLDQLSNLAHIDIFLTDIVGVLHVEKDNLDNANQILHFQLKDHRNVVEATFSGGLAMLLRYKISQETQQPIIIILASAKVTMFQGNIHISNVPATMFYLNYKHEAVSRLRQMIEEKLYTIAEIKDFGIISEQSCSIINGNDSGIGVVIRDHEGKLLKIVSGSIPNLTARASELWAMLVGLRTAFFEGENRIELESDNDEAVREWLGCKWYIDNNHESLIQQLEQRKKDSNLQLFVKAIEPTQNKLARYLAADGARNRSELVVFRSSFGRVNELWMNDMGLGTIQTTFQEKEEEEFLIQQNDNEIVNLNRINDESHDERNWLLHGLNYYNMGQRPSQSLSCAMEGQPGASTRMPREKTRKRKQPKRIDRADCLSNEDTKEWEHSVKKSIRRIKKDMSQVSNKVQELAVNIEILTEEIKAQHTIFAKELKMVKVDMEMLKQRMLDF